MTMLEILPVIAFVAIIVTILRVATRRETPRKTLWLWLWPALPGAAFAGFSAVTLAREGVVQFWVNHTTTYAGNQVWFDLLIAVTLAFWLLAPRARAVGMALLPWAIAVILTASVALLPMVAIVLWREDRARRQRFGAPRREG